jgi:thiol-disulfide isomerase/thioredoxin
LGSYDAIMELMMCVIDASHIVDSWCGPCKTLSPILEKLAGDVNTKTGSGRPIDLVTVDADEHDVLAQRYNVCTTVLTHPTDDDD